MIKRFDLHLHTEYSDGEGTVQDKVRKAEELGLALIAITDHFSEPLPDRLTPARLGELSQLVRNKEYPLPVLLGVETGIDGSLPRHLAGKIDLVIRSVHYLRRPVRAKSPFDPLYWAAYKEEVLSLLKVPGDVLGHVEGYLPLPLGDLSTTFAERRAMDKEVARRFFSRRWWSEVARLAAGNEIAIELHSSSQTPRLDCIRLCQEEGCLFSVGSDAHATEDMAKIEWAFEVIEELKIPSSQLLPYARGWLE